MRKLLGKFAKNENGLTLIELLAVLAIGTIVIGLAFSVLHTSMNTYKKTEGQQLLQQEANLMVMQLRTIHRENAAYTIEYIPLENGYFIIFPDGSKQAFSQSKYKTEISIAAQPITSTNSITIGPNIKQYKIVINIMDPRTNNEFTINTGISRL